jgi:DNA-3-methyladenine glycosylase II
LKAKSVKAAPARATVEQVLSRADPGLARIIEAVVSRIGPQRPPRSKATPLQALIRAVIYQRMAATAAATIYKNLRAQLTDVFSPQKVLSLSMGTLRSVGLSASKAQYVRNLAQWFSANPRIARKLASLPDEAIIEELTSIPGIGVWTINVFLIFSLQRPDVVPSSDLGIRRGLQLADGLAGAPTPQAVAERANRWRPYRSIASVYLWNSIRLKLTAADLAPPSGRY